MQDKTIVFKILIFSFLIFSGLDAQEINQNPIEIKSVISSANEIELRIKVDEGFRAYLDQFELLPKNKFSNIDIYPTQTFTDPIKGIKKKGVVGEGFIKAHAYDMDISGKLRYQVCTDEVCYLPKEIPFQANIGGDKSRFTLALEKGILFALITVFIAGLLSSLTPCVFPMIPITASILGTKVLNKTRLKSFLISTVYVLGVSTTYSVLGVLAASTGSILGIYLSNPKIVIALSAIFVLMGLSMYGFFELKLPTSISSKLKVERGGFIGVFLSGVVAGVVASSCVGPILVGLLLFVSKTQSVFLGFIFLFTFALGFGVILVGIGLFSRFINVLPKVGGWLEGVSFLFGTTMIGMGFYYMKPVLNERVFYVVVGIFALGISLAFGLTKIHTTNLSSKLKKFTLSVFFAFGLLMLANGIINFQLDKVISSRGSKLWLEYDKNLFEEAIAMGKPVIIDFWASWCASCVELDKKTFSDEKVISALSDFALLKVDYTLMSDANKKLKNDLKIVGLPTVLFYDREGRLRSDLTLTGFENVENFLKRLEKL